MIGLLHRELDRQRPTIGIRAEVPADDGTTDRSRRKAFYDIRTVRFRLLLSSREIVEEDTVGTATAGSNGFGEEMDAG